LLAVFAGVVGVAAFVLQRVFATVFFAVTVAYVLIPLQRFLRSHGVGPRVAAGLATLISFLGVVALLLPLGAALYLRRELLFTFFGQTPEEVTLRLGGLSYTVDLSTVQTEVQEVAGDLALATARELPAFSFKLFLFVLVVYALLLRPGRVGEALLRPVPRRYHDVALAFHRRTRAVLYGIYVLQAAVAGATFLVAMPVFLALGYESWFTMSVLSGVLQFIPVLGPSIVIVVVGAVELLSGDPQAAVTVVVVGLLVVGVLPDLLIRPRLAHAATDMPASLYFIGFVGGTLSVGIVGLVAGPVVVAWVSQSVALLSAETTTEGRRTTVEEWTDRGVERPVADGEGGRDGGPDRPD